MTSLFHFEDKVHCKNLTRAESTPLLFPRLLFQVLEHIDFPAKPRLVHRRDYEDILIVDRWQTKPRSFHLPPTELTEDQPVADLPIEEQPPPAVHTEEPQVPASSVPTLASTAPLPMAPASSTPPEPSAPSTTVLQMLLDRAPQHHHLRMFLYPLGISWSSWMHSAHSPPRLHHFQLPMQSYLRGTHTEAVIAHNQAIILQIQSHLGLPPISQSVSAQASSVPPPAKPTPTTQADPTVSLDLLETTAVATMPPVAP